jgi:hypothetical protein
MQREDMGRGVRYAGKRGGQRCAYTGHQMHVVPLLCSVGSAHTCRERVSREGVGAEGRAGRTGWEAARPREDDGGSGFPSRRSRRRSRAAAVGTYLEASSTRVSAWE